MIGVAVASDCRAAVCAAEVFDVALKLPALELPALAVGAELAGHSPIVRSHPLRCGSVTAMSEGGDYARPVRDVESATWADAVRAARDDGLTFFDWLTAVDEDDNGFRVVTHLWSVPERRGVLLRTMLPHTEPELATITDIFPGAAWHERETFEMFGIVFQGHHDLRKLLLPDEFAGNPLRKDFVLAARAVKEWPGAVEPGDDAPTRRRLTPPGVPDESWVRGTDAAVD